MPSGAHPVWVVGWIKGKMVGVIWAAHMRTPPLTTPVSPSGLAVKSLLLVSVRSEWQTLHGVTDGARH